ncbi:MAG: redoxin domain-containing protein [Pseudomonadota bacterium]
MDAGTGPTLWLAAGAGVVTVASPCVLPVLPALPGASWGAHSPWRPLWVVLGFVGSFAGVALLLGAALRGLALDAAAPRAVAAGVLAASGLLMAWPRLGEQAGRLLQPLARWADAALPATPAARVVDGSAGAPGAARAAGAAAGPAGARSSMGALATGAALGAIWAPCAGPALATIVGLLAQGHTGQAAPLLLAYGAGAGLPMLAIAWGGQRASLRVPALSRHAGRIRQAFGVLVMATAAAVLLDRDADLAARLAPPLRSAPPATLPADPAGPQAPDATARPPALHTATQATRAAQGGPTVPAAGPPAPEFTGITAWLNTPQPLSLASLRGRPVLVDFWTWNCVNCIRTLPHLQRLHERYAGRGLVVIGVHTPEFAHERGLAGLRAAIRRHGLGYPVAQDNAYATWQAWSNAYWPAAYLVDAQGRVVYHRIGEGGEAELEARIERLLSPQ